MKYTERKINEVTLVTAYSPETDRFYAIKQTQNGHGASHAGSCTHGKNLEDFQRLPDTSRRKALGV